MNNRVFSDEFINRSPSDEHPIPDQNGNRHLNSTAWLHALENRTRQMREREYEQHVGESERLYQLLQLARQQMQRKSNKGQHTSATEPEK